MMLRQAKALILMLSRTPNCSKDTDGEQKLPGSLEVLQLRTFPEVKFFQEFSDTNFSACADLKMSSKTLIDSENFPKSFGREPWR
jgi:hypothetical protein